MEVEKTGLGKTRGGGVLSPGDLVIEDSCAVSNECGPYWCRGSSYTRVKIVVPVYGWG